MQARKRTWGLVPLLLFLAVTQIVGWGTVSFLAVAAGEMAADLHVGVPTVFAGLSVFYVAMGVVSPLLAGSFARHGARPLMIAGAVASACGFALLSVQDMPFLYFAA